MRDFAWTLRRHEEDILNYFEMRIDNGAVEGMNNKAKVVSHRCYGFRTASTYITALYHCLGKLPEPKLVHRFLRGAKKSWRGLKDAWTEPDVRDEVVDFVRSLHGWTDIAQSQLVRWLGIARLRFCAWKGRYGKANEHNGLIPRDSWLLPWEREVIVAYFIRHPDEGYRRLA